MRVFGDIEAVKTILHRENPDIEHRFSPNLPGDPWHAAVVREAQKLNYYTEYLITRSIQIYQEQVRIETNSDGRVVDIRHPVRLSGGIRESIELLEEAEPVLEGFETRFENYSQKAVFEQDDIYEQIAAESLNFCDTIIPRVRLYIHTYLWIMWTNEALNQANQFGGLLMNEYDFEQLSVNSFPYIAHPPLIVATIACSTMIEEVGAYYVNGCVEDEHRSLDNTSASRILQDVREFYPDSEDFDIDKIDKWVVDTRNDISHYVTQRGETVSLDGFQMFYEAIVEGIELVDSVLTDLVTPPQMEFQEQLDRLPS
jgi:hypothetical protein